MGNLGVKVTIAEAFEFLDESFGLRSRQILGEQDAVDEHPQLRILKISLCQITAALHRDFVAHVLERADIVADGTSVALRTVVQLKKVDDFLLGQSMVDIGILSIFLLFPAYTFIGIPPL